MKKYWIWKNDKENIDKWNEYTTTRNVYNKKVDLKKNDETKNDIIKASNNQRNMWKCLKKIIPSKKKEASDEIEFDSGCSANYNEIANKFNNFFIQSIIEIKYRHTEYSNKQSIRIPTSKH